MQLNRFSDYSLRVLMYAAAKGESFQIDEVSEAYGISRNHVAKVVQRLGQLGYLATRRGRGGGIELGRASGDIRLGSLVRVTETGSELVECFDPETDNCSISGCCRLKPILARALEAFYATLDESTLDDLVKGEALRIIETPARPLRPADA